MIKPWQNKHKIRAYIRVLGHSRYDANGPASPPRIIHPFVLGGRRSQRRRQYIFCKATPEKGQEHCYSKTNLSIDDKLDLLCIEDWSTLKHISKQVVIPFEYFFFEKCLKKVIILEAYSFKTKGRGSIHVDHFVWWEHDLVVTTIRTTRTSTRTFQDLSEAHGWGRKYLSPWCCAGLSPFKGGNIYRGRGKETRSYQPLCCLHPVYSQYVYQYRIWGFEKKKR